MVAAATRQMSRLWHTSNIYLNPTIHQYATALTDTLPGDLKVSDTLLWDFKVEGHTPVGLQGGDTLPRDRKVGDILLYH